jgi:hypothetical protein
MGDAEASWGELLRSWRENTKRWSQQELVERVVQLAYRTNAERGANLTVALLQKWETGAVRRPHYAYQRLLGALGAPLPGRKGAESRSLAGAGRGQAVSSNQHAVTDPPSIAAIRAMSDSFQVSDRKLGGGKLYHTVCRYLRSEIAPSLLDPPEDCSSTDMFSAAASLTEIAGWMAHDGGDNDRARQHLSQAYRLAVVGENAALSANVCASMAHLAIQLDLPDDAERISAAGLNYILDVEGAKHLVARLRAMQARSYAIRGSGYECAAALEAAHDSLDSGKDDNVDVGWIAGFDEASLAGESALCFLSLGSLDHAESESRKVVHLRSGDRVRSRALGQLTLANVLMREGSYDEAAQIGLDICAVAPVLNSARVHSGLSMLGKALAPYGTSREVAAFFAAKAEACGKPTVLHQEAGWPV